MVGDYEKQIIE